MAIVSIFPKQLSPQVVCFWIDVSELGRKDANKKCNFNHLPPPPRASYGTGMVPVLDANCMHIPHLSFNTTLGPIRLVRNIFEQVSKLAQVQVK
jgi:hypothetical protein